MGNILIIEDDKGARLALSRAIEKWGYDVLQAGNGLEGLKKLKSKAVDLVLCDIQLPGINGLEVLERIQKEHPNVLVVMMTAFGSVEKAVKAVKLGAIDFLEKPLDLSIVKKIIPTSLQTKNIQKDRKKLLSEIKRTNFFEGMIGSGEKMQEVFETIIKIAPSRATVLITGETGTGKELVARALHRLSSRTGSLVTVNLTAFPDTLIEDELFGHDKGAHSTAFNDRDGRLAEADGGTFFLDELGEIPLNMQVKLLRVIEEREFQRLGANKTHKVDIRFIAATHVNLEKKVAEGKFREDLYYRLKVLKIELPPLREHREDIPSLVNHFIRRHSEENNKEIESISEEALNLLSSYDWPGNIRELERAIESAIVMCEGNILEPEHFSKEIQNTKIKGDVVTIQVGSSSLKEVEKELIRCTFLKTGGNKTKTAKILGIGIRTLYRKIDEYDLPYKNEKKNDEGSD
ncbi:sigma-54-dependent transcriptional regulator [Candidatus Uabimicrobium sp. HlEnr_7]|uniref:sigma-54-dependent transcriptional regulator n=1 Tax=Candidatus Uabimicrobium helgolandensis TaxID=3095367 RepID=UPI003557F461